MSVQPSLDEIPVAANAWCRRCYNDRQTEGDLEPQDQPLLNDELEEVPDFEGYYKRVCFKILDKEQTQFIPITLALDTVEPEALLLSDKALSALIAIGRILFDRDSGTARIESGGQSYSVKKPSASHNFTNVMGTALIFKAPKSYPVL